MKNSLWIVAAQLIIVTILSGYFAYLYGNVYHGHIFMAIGIFGIPIIAAIIFNNGLKRKFLMSALLAAISFFVCGYISVFLMGYY